MTTNMQRRRACFLKYSNLAFPTIPAAARKRDDSQRLSFLVSSLEALGEKEEAKKLRQILAEQFPNHPQL